MDHLSMVVYCTNWGSVGSIRRLCHSDFSTAATSLFAVGWLGNALRINLVDGVLELAESLLDSTHESLLFLLGLG